MKKNESKNRVQIDDGSLKNISGGCIHKFESPDGSVRFDVFIDDLRFVGNTLWPPRTRYGSYKIEEEAIAAAQKLGVSTKFFIVSTKMPGANMELEEKIL